MSTPDIIAAIIIVILAMMLLFSYKRNLQLTEECGFWEAEFDVEKSKHKKKEELWDTHTKKQYRLYSDFAGEVESILFGDIRGRTNADIINALKAMDEALDLYQAASQCPESNCQHEHPTVDPRPSNEPAGVPRTESQPAAATQSKTPEAGAHAGERIEGGRV